MVLLLVLWFIQRAEIRSLKKRYVRLLMGSEGLNLEEALNGYAENIHRNEADIKSNSARLDRLEDASEKTTSGIGLVRYNAFKESGGELSFSAAFLNRKNEGLVLTGIVGREETRVYVKDIEAGGSKYLLSEEEKSAIKIAQSKSR